MAESIEAELSCLNLQSETEKDRLINKFKEVYKEKGAHDLQSQIKYLAALADFYHQKGAENSDWVCLLKAHALYNSTAARDGDNGDRWSYKAFEVQKTYWGDKIELTYEQQREITYSVRRELTAVRRSTQSKLDNITANYTNFDCKPHQLMSEHNTKLVTLFNEQVNLVSNYCTENIVKIFSLIVGKAVKIVGEAPCGFCAAAMGSIARGEATPYSDLEFLLLIEITSDDIVGYFQDLAMTIYFIIGNLQETKLKYMAIEELSEWFVDVTTNGLKIDGLQKQAGNIPTGNGSSEQHNQFICTVEQLISKYENIFVNPDPKESLRGDLTALLSCTAPIFGDTKLLNMFSNKIQQLKPNKARQEASKKMLAKDTETYDFYPDTNMGQRRNLKKDIYRYPSLLAFDLKILHGINQTSTALFTELVEKGIISSSAAKSFGFAYFCAIYMRLSTYLYHGSQNESVSVLSPNPDFQAAQELWYVDRSLLIHMMIHLLPLKKAVSSGDLNCFDTAASEVDIKHSAALVSYYCEDYQTCCRTLEDLYPKNRNPQILHMMAYCYLELGRYQEAEELYSELLHASEQGELADSHNKVNPSIGDTDPDWFDSDHAHIATLYTSLGLVHSTQGDYKKAELYYIKSLDLQQRLYNNSDHPDIANSYSNLGYVYSAQGDYKKAELYYTQSLEMSQRLYGDCDHPCLSSAYKNLGFVCSTLADYKRAKAYYSKSLDMEQRLTSSSDQPHVSNSYNNLGYVMNSAEGDFKQAEIYYTKSLKIVQRMYSSSDHPDISSSLSNLGNVYSDQGDFETAEAYYNKSLDMELRLYRNSDHPDIAKSYNNLGNVYTAQGDHEEAELYYTKSLEMAQRLYKNLDHPDIASSFNNLGLVFTAQENFEEAERYHTKSLEMSLRLYSNADHPDIAGSYNNLGNVYYAQGDYRKADNYHKKSLEMNQRLYSNSDHPDIAGSYKNLGLVYFDQGDYKRAQIYHCRSLEMEQRLYNSDHPDISKSYSNLGYTYSAQGDYERAKWCYTKSLEMDERLYGNSDHPHLSNSYKNLGYVYSAQADYKRANTYYMKSLGMEQRLYNSNHPAIS